MADVNAIKARQQELAEAVRRAEEEYEYWRELSEQPRFRARLEAYRGEADAQREALVGLTKTDEIKSTQAEVRARRRLLEMFDPRKLLEPLEQQRRELRKFEEDHALYLQAPPKKAKGASDATLAI